MRRRVQTDVVDGGLARAEKDGGRVKVKAVARAARADAQAAEEPDVVLAGTAREPEGSVAEESAALAGAVMDSAARAPAGGAAPAPRRPPHLRPDATCRTR